MSDPMPAGIKTREKEWVFRCGRCGWKEIFKLEDENGERKFFPPIFLSEKGVIYVVPCPRCHTIMESDHEI
jgi:uncharacterized C2H2 Zn-finger protein